MEELEVIECVELKSNESSNEFKIIAIDFKKPTYLSGATSVHVPKGTMVEVRGNEIIQGSKRIGDVIEMKDSSSIKVSTDYDIKYTGGYSLDGSTVYLDEHFPQKLEIKGKIISATASIGLHHELPEKWLSDEGYEYPYAHEVATGIEKKYVESQGVKWADYCEVVDRNLRNVYKRDLEKSPPSLDLAPYLYCRDQEALKEIRKSKEE
jgi:hypothetical protein